jgi:hypothetical protein
VSDPTLTRDPVVGAGLLRVASLPDRLLMLAGVSLLVAPLLDTPWLSLLTLPAALIGPGHVLLLTIARRLTADPWLAWTLRVLLSLALWTLLGALFALVPGLEPRWLGTPIGFVLLLVALARTEQRRQRLAPAPEQAPAGAAVIRKLPAKLVGVAIFAVVAIGSLGAGYLISTGGDRPVPYLSLGLTPADVLPYGANGRLSAAVELRNGGRQRITVSLDLRVDGRRLPVRPVGAVPAGDTVRAALDDVPLPRCWSRLTIAVAGVAPSLAPRPLVAYGPGSSPAGCPAG